MAPKKAAKKVAAKHAKKHAKKHAGKHHHAGKDVRRAYEHLGRLEAFQDAVPAAVARDVSGLIELAQVAMQGDDSKSAADLLRAAEHLAFAGLAPIATEDLENEALIAALTDEFDHLREKAEEHWEDGEEERETIVETLYASALMGADAALEKSSYRRAMELIRAADALAHVEMQGILQLPEGGKKGRLKG